MVAVHPGASAAGPITTASSIATGFGARLFGVAARDVVMPHFEEGGSALADIISERAKEDARTWLADAETVFHRIAGGRGHAIEWRWSVAAQRSYLLSQAAAADLFVIGRQGPDDQSFAEGLVAPGDLVVDLGRPMLMVPPGVDRLDARRVVIGWNDGREARRAIRDALPLLQRAELVWVASFGAGIAHADDVCRYLGLHHVAARHVQRPDEQNAAAGLIDLANEEGADLIVCGAYGHSRLREWLLGGVTRALLDTAPVCCLMSH